MRFVFQHVCRALAEPVAKRREGSGPREHTFATGGVADSGNAE